MVFRNFFTTVLINCVEYEYIYLSLIYGITYYY